MKNAMRLHKELNVVIIRVIIILVMRIFVIVRIT